MNIYGILLETKGETHVHSVYKREKTRNVALNKLKQTIPTLDGFETKFSVFTNILNG